MGSSSPIYTLSKLWSESERTRANPVTLTTARILLHNANGFFQPMHLALPIGELVPILVMNVLLAVGFIQGFPQTSKESNFTVMPWVHYAHLWLHYLLNAHPYMKSSSRNPGGGSVSLTLNMLDNVWSTKSNAK